MKLISCHVENFGKLSGVYIDFTEGINLFHEPNAWGKSTLAAFLRVMFYGFDSKKESGLFDKERVVFRPWQGGTYGGELDFSYHGKSYRISRTFGKTEKTDEFHLYDRATNLESHDFSSDIGSEIFGLDSSSFKRSAFIAQNDCECGCTDVINAKLGNLVENTNDINNFDSAQKKIHDRMNKLSPDRATGSMKKRRNMMTLLQEELRGFEAAETASVELSHKLAEKQEQKKELSKIRGQYAKALQVASEESRRESRRANYVQLCQDAKNSRETLDTYKKIFPGQIPEDRVFEQKNQEVQMLGVLKTTIHNLGLSEQEKEQYQKLTDTFAEGVPKEKEISEMEQEMERLGKLREEKNQLETKISYFEAMAMKKEQPDETVSGYHSMLAVSFLFLAVAVAGAAVVFFVPAVRAYDAIIFGTVAGMAFLAVLLLVLRKVFMGKDKKRIRRQKQQREEEEKRIRKPVEEVSATLEKASSEAAKIEKNVNCFFEKYHIYCSVEEARAHLYELKSRKEEFERLQSRVKKSESAEVELEHTRNSLLDFVSETGADMTGDIAAGIAHLQTKAAEYRLAETAYRETIRKKEQFEEEYDVSEFAQNDKCPYSLDELNSMIEEVDRGIEDVREAAEQYTHQMEDIQEQLDLRDEKEMQLAVCKKEQEEEQRQFELLGLTQKFLQNAKEQFSARYLGPIENGFGKYYELLTGDKSRNWMVDANIKVQMKEQGELRETKWMSAGYQDLLGVCMRLALVDAMYPDEKPFLVLDDPFVNLDEEKMAHGNELLSKIASEYQILYFTCHSSRNVTE